MIKRILSGAVGIIILFLVFCVNTKLIIVNIATTLVALMALWEFYNAFSQKGYKPFAFLGYLITFATLGISYVEQEQVKIFLFVILPILLFVLFCKSILTNMKFNVADIAVTMLGVVYISFFFSFIPFICNLNNGNYYIWYVFGGAWLTDTFAYFIGSKFGKHKIFKISPKKSIEGCIAGVIGCALFFALYTFYLNSININLNVFTMALVGLVVSVISQVGDLSASSIKRYCDLKDFGSIMPGHGGVLDRFDSVIMVAPFVYMLFQFVFNSASVL